MINCQSNNLLFYLKKSNRPPNSASFFNIKCRGCDGCNYFYCLVSFYMSKCTSLSIVLHNIMIISTKSAIHFFTTAFSFIFKLLECSIYSFFNPVCIFSLLPLQMKRNELIIKMHNLRIAFSSISLGSGSRNSRVSRRNKTKRIART